MQSGGSGGGPARNPGMGPAGRTNSTSSAASPTSSSSSVQQQQQQQQLASRQVKSYEMPNFLTLNLAFIQFQLYFN